MKNVLRMQVTLNELLLMAQNWVVKSLTPDEFQQLDK